MTTENNKPSTPSFAESLSQIREMWVEHIKTASQKLKQIPDILDLQDSIYTLRQEAAEHWHAMVDLQVRLSKDYKVESAKKFKEYKTHTNVMYKSETNINSLVEADLVDAKYKIEILDNHISYMKETIQTIDNIIYGIKSRIEVENFLRSSKI